MPPARAVTLALIYAFSPLLRAETLTLLATWLDTYSQKYPLRKSEKDSGLYPSLYVCYSLTENSVSPVRKIKLGFISFGFALGLGVDTLAPSVSEFWLISFTLKPLSIQKACRDIMHHVSNIKGLYFVKDWNHFHWYEFIWFWYWNQPHSAFWLIKNIWFWSQIWV